MIKKMLNQWDVGFGQRHPTRFAWNSYSNPESTRTIDLHQSNGTDRTPNYALMSRPHIGPMSSNAKMTLFEINFCLPKIVYLDGWISFMSMFETPQYLYLMLVIWICASSSGKIKKWKLQCSPEAPVIVLTICISCAIYQSGTVLFLMESIYIPLNSLSMVKLANKSPKYAMNIFPRSKRARNLTINLCCPGMLGYSTNTVAPISKREGSFLSRYMRLPALRLIGFEP